MRKSILAGLLSLCALTAAASSGEKPDMIRIPIMPAPVIDGQISAQEQLRCGGISGVLKHQTTTLIDRDAVFYLGWTDKGLYFACSSELPPEGQKLLARVRKDSELIFKDDTVEIHIRPPKSQKVFQYAFNPRNHKFAARYDIMSGAVINSPKEFKSIVRSASTMNGKVWQLEAEIPFSELGFTGTPDPDTPWQMQMARTWHRPEEDSSWTRSVIYCDFNTMGLVYLDKDAPAVNFRGLGLRRDQDDYEIKFDLFNPGKKTLTLRGFTLVKSTAVPRMKNGDVKLHPGQSGEFKMEYTEKAPFIFDFSGEIIDAATGKVCFRRNFSFSKRKKVRWDGASNNFAVLEIGYYPYKEMIKARYGSPELPAGRNITGAVFTLRSPEGKQLGEAHQGSAGRGGFSAVWKAEKLPEGEYQVLAEVTDKNGEKSQYIQKFLVKHFEWEHNNIGKERVVIPPFKPLQTDTAAKTVKALQTGYKLGNGFWQEIYAQGENILAAPVQMQVNGNPGFFREVKTSFTETAADRVRAEVQLTGKGLHLEVKQEYDYDGMSRTDLTFTPEQEFTASDVTLTIPVKEEFAVLHHCVNDVPRYHPAGFLPKKSGVLWESRQGKLHPQVSGNFWPYVWLGDLYKGICYFAPNDRNWSLDQAKPALEIVRENGAVALKIHLVNQKVQWREPVTITLGFQPTPVKPRPKGWQVFFDRKADSPHTRVITLLSGYSWGTPHWWNSWPVGNDYTIINHIARNVRQDPEKKLSEQVIRDFLKRHQTELEESLKRSYYGRTLAVFDDHLHRTLNLSRYSYHMYPYLNPRAADSKWEMYQVYQNEWMYSEYRMPVDYDEYNIVTSESYQDQFLWHARKLVREGLDGLYYDNVRLRAVFDAVRGPAYVRPDGTMQPYFDFFTFRQLLKRTATMLYLEKKFMIEDRPFLVMHMTNGAVIPFLSFGAMQVDMESEFGPKEWHDRFSEGYYLSETIATQAGCIPEVLAIITGNDVRHVCRTFLAVQLAFDFPIVNWAKPTDNVFWDTWKIIHAFGYGSDQCEITPSWQPGKHAVTADHPDTRVSVYRRKDKPATLAAVADMGNQAKKATLDVSALNYCNPTATDAESGAKLPVYNGKITLDLPRRDFRLILIKGE